MIWPQQSLHTVLNYTFITAIVFFKLTQKVIKILYRVNWLLYEKKILPNEVSTDK